jgi:glycerol uptake operon antiterminator
MSLQEFLALASLHPVAAALKTTESMQEALASNARLLFVLKGDGFHLVPLIRQAHRLEKGVIVHIDLVDGIGKDHAGVAYLRRLGVDGIITSRSQLVTASRAEGLITIQRLLLLDDSALDSGLRTILRAAPDIVEILPGILFPQFADTLQQAIQQPLIAGGFIRTHQDVARVQAAGALLCSSSTPALWQKPTDMEE